MLVTDMSPQQLNDAVIEDSNKALAEKNPYGGMEVRHVKTGRDYIVLCLATIEATMTPAVVYGHGEEMWVRPLDEFCDGRFVGR
jgi:hypothetical protein